MRPSSATIVSQPMMISGVPALRTARALRSAFSSATASGSPSSSSATVDILTLKSSFSPVRISRRCGEREASTRGSGGVALELAEEQGGLARGRLRRVRAVHHVGAHLDREVAANRAGGRLQGVGRADQLPRRPDGVGALEHHRQDRARGDEVDELPEERPLGVLAVVLPGKPPPDRHVAKGDDLQPLALEAGDDLAAERTGEGVGLYEDQRAVHVFLCWRDRIRWVPPPRRHRRIVPRSSVLSDACASPPRPLRPAQPGRWARPRAPRRAAARARSAPRPCRLWRARRGGAARAGPPGPAPPPPRTGRTARADRDRESGV